jgi:hypothetical protein
MSVAEFNVTPTVYDVLDGDNVSPVIYAEGWTARHLTTSSSNRSSLWDAGRLLPGLAENRLPAYSFLEPGYGSGLTDGVFRPQNDQHPDSDVRSGEDLIFSVYSDLRQSQSFEEHHARDRLR